MELGSVGVHVVCAELGGVARNRELTARGFGRAAIGRALRAGVIERVRGGLYVAADGSATLRTAIIHGGVLGCISVLREAGIWVLPLDERVHVSIAPHGHTYAHEKCSCVAHWGDVEIVAGRVGMVDALAQSLLYVGEDAFFAALESALRLGLLTDADRVLVKQRIADSRAWLVDLASRASESGLESLLKVRLHRLGLRLASQVAVPGVGRVDFVLGDRLILEVDGKPGHESEGERHKDRVRDAVAASHGFDTLRFDYALVVHDWPLVEAAIQEKLRRGLHLDPWAEAHRAG